MDPDPNIDPNQENPYDFILRDQQQAVPQATVAASNRTKQLIIFGVFVVVVLIIVMVTISIISSSGKDRGEEAVSVRAYQNEVQRVMELGNPNVRSAELKKKLATINIILLNDGGTMDQVISSKDAVPTPAQLAQHRNSGYDQDLTDSLQVDNHDAVYEQIVDELMNNYFAAVRQAETAAKTQTERNQLSSVRQNVETLYQVAQQSDEPTDTNEQQNNQDEQPTDDSSSVPG